MIDTLVSIDGQKPPKVQEYLDYRAFLNDYYEWRRAADTAFTQRVFAREIGLPASGSSMLPAILKGRRNLSQNLRVKFTRALSLPERAGRYFDLLVQFNQAKSMVEKNFFFSQLSRFHASKAHVLQGTQFEYFSHWHYSAVRSYFLMETEERNPSRIAAKLFPEVSPEMVEGAIKVLLDLDLVKKTVNGYKVTEKHLTTPPDVKAEAARLHVHELSRLALEVLDRSPPDLRQFNTLMFSISPQGFTSLKDRVQSFMEEVREILDRDQGEDRIYTLNLQLFPNSRLAGLKPPPAKAKG